MRNLKEAFNPTVLVVGQLMDAIRREHEEMTEEEHLQWIIETSQNSEYAAFFRHTFPIVHSDAEWLPHLVKRLRTKLDYLKKWKREIRENER